MNTYGPVVLTVNVNHWSSPPVTPAEAVISPNTSLCVSNFKRRLAAPVPIDPPYPHIHILLFHLIDHSSAGGDTAVKLIRKEATRQ